MGRVTTMTDQLAASYLADHRARQRAFHEDPTYHAEFTRLRTVLDVVDRALADARHTEDDRHSMCRLLLIEVPGVLEVVDRALNDAGHTEDDRHSMRQLLIEGPGDPDAALQRVADQAQAVRDEMRRTPPPVRLAGVVPLQPTQHQPRRSPMGGPVNPG